MAVTDKHLHEHIPFLASRTDGVFPRGQYLNFHLGLVGQRATLYVIWSRKWGRWCLPRRHGEFAEHTGYFLGTSTIVCCSCTPPNLYNLQNSSYTILTHIVIYNSWRVCVFKGKIQYQQKIWSLLLMKLEQAQPCKGLTSSLCVSQKWWGGSQLGWSRNGFWRNR